ncbi:creatininase family protein [Romboutsia lituseburensis]|uniref:creatininase family protein n=1 Tax=Romboutsia lituseburensis TaxID=1537 RepID=UPI00215AFB33|nr:creatininase family protein [Romboutsia lituseburensis]MCR8744801.1 creatininase family protein [Romboutsia lituseburensis]
MTLMANMTWYEFNDKKDEDVVILPIGSVEQHGPHLPFIYGYYNIRRICRTFRGAY